VTATNANPALHRILRRAFPGCRVEVSRELKGGVSSRAVVADLVLPDATTKRVVVRRPCSPTPEETPRVVAREHELLSRCAALGISAPKPCFLDRAESALVLEHVDGAPEFAPVDPELMLRQMATQLARIHEVALDSDFAFLPRRSESAGRVVREPPARLDAALGEPRLRAALAGLWPWRQENADALLHGDYWPGNLLWKAGQLAAVLDWEEAEIGDPLADLAVARLDILWAFGDEATQRFTECYREQTRIDWTNLPRWDLFAALRPMSHLELWARAYPEPPISRPDVTESSMREGHRRFVERALRSLGMDP
jgi:aminoglycoside phosphotransferase (APT) family kinase protein